MSVGKGIKHDSAAAHVTGSAIYVDDIPPRAAQLHVAIGMAEIAAGAIQSIDLQAVKSSEGVVDVLQESDLHHLKDIGAVFPGDPLLTSTTVEFCGQAIFAVAARSYREAQIAVRKASITYTEHEPILTLKAALHQKHYVRPPHQMRRGDVSAALDAAPHRISGEMYIGGQEHFYLEGQVALAIPTEQGGVTVYSSNQNPTEAQHLVAGVLGLTMHSVTVETRRMGGGFGGKETQATACCVFAALFAVRNQCAVNCRLSRSQDMILTGKRHPFYNQYEVGFDNNGVIVGVHHVLAGQCGNSPDLSDAIVDRAMFHCDNAYYLPNVLIDGIRCKTNTVSNTAFRGFGGPQGMMAAEAVIDAIAFKLKLDPLDVRKSNLYDIGSRNITPYKQTIDAFSVPRLIDELEATSNYRKRRIAIREFNQHSQVLKKGLALTPVKFGISFTVSHLNQGGALLHLYNDGSVMLNHGGTEMGQGLMVKVAQVVATTLGMHLDRVAISATRTDKVPNTSPTAASSGTDINGMAALDAANKLKQRLLDFLIEKHNVSEHNIQFLNDEVVVSGIDASSKQQHYTWPALANEAYLARVQLSATGFYKTPNIFYDRTTASGSPFLYFANGAAVSEVIIDTLTGETRLLRTDILHDVGHSINPAIDRGQIEGGYIQGLGWLTSEELKWDGAGRLLTVGPATYKIPAISDAPTQFNVDLLQNSPNEAPTVFRSKAVGEPPLMLAISVFCAIRDAIASIANHEVFPALNAPATPEEVLRVCDLVAEQSNKTGVV